jgi:hypothetical protein
MWAPIATATITNKLTITRCGHEVNGLPSASGDTPT